MLIAQWVTLPLYACTAEPITGHVMYQSFTLFLGHIERVATLCSAIPGL